MPVYTKGLVKSNLLDVLKNKDKPQMLVIAEQNAVVLRIILIYPKYNSLQK